MATPARDTARAKQRRPPRPPGVGQRGPLPWRIGAKELALLERLGAAGCSCEQAAASVGRDVDTVDAAVQRQRGEKLREFLAGKRAKGEAALLLKAHALAASGNTAMLKLSLAARLGWDKTPGQFSAPSAPEIRQSIIFGDKEIVF